MNGEFVFLLRVGGYCGFFMVIFIISFYDYFGFISIRLTSPWRKEDDERDGRRKREGRGYEVRVSEKERETEIFTIHPHQ